MRTDRALKVDWCLEAQQRSAERLEISRGIQVVEHWHYTEADDDRFGTRACDAR
jgi:hypothetical protein